MQFSCWTQLYTFALCKLINRELIGATQKIWENNFHRSWMFLADLDLLRFYLTRPQKIKELQVRWSAKRNNASPTPPHTKFVLLLKMNRSGRKMLLSIRQRFFLAPIWTVVARLVSPNHPCRSVQRLRQTLRLYIVLSVNWQHHGNRVQRKKGVVSFSQIFTATYQFQLQLTRTNDE